MDEKIIISESDRYKLLIVAAVSVVFMSVYLTYSIGKFKTLSNRSIVQSSVVMKVIQHNVYSVCPRCGSKGRPLCPTCNVAMYWNGYSGNFVCPACGQSGFPRCPRCKEYMSWIEAQ
ncbi:MAG: hypothetical protein HQL26_10515 [Candidatus Omnitrophica bacterium]|nr:hypothetical protein [Candidatus Omnitrophota bacterium]